LIVDLVRQRRWQFAGLWLSIVFAASFGVAAQYGMKLIVDAMSAQRTGDAVWGSLALFIGLITAESVFWRLSGWLGCNTVVAVGIDVRLRLFRYLSDHSVDFVTRNSSGALGGRITATAGATGALVAALTWKIAPPCIDFVGAVVVLLTIQPWMALALVCFVLLIGAALAAFGRRGKPLHEAYAAENSKVTGELVDLVANLWTLKAFSAREREIRRIAQTTAREGQAQRRSWLFLEKARVLHDVCVWVMTGTMMTWSIHRWLEGTSTAGDVVLVSALSFRILLGSRELALAYVEATQHVGVLREMLKVIAVPHDPKDRPGAAICRPAGSIRIENVDFAYPDGMRVLENFSLHIPTGQRVGVVGPSGSGKSTLLALVQRLYDVQSGAILLDGQDVRSVSQDSLRATIAVVPQEISLLHRSLRENLRYGRPDATDEEVERAAHDANCEEFINQLPHGYETLVGERGVRLSGGQRQRVGIARAMLKNAPILLLDEATSALDTPAERRIHAALHRLMAGHTVVAVAHRLSTVASLDRVVVLQHGRVVEDGPPGRLRHAGGLYEQLWKAQAKGQETA
jgi:ATP-binding cassette subfamily B protein